MTIYTIKNYPEYRIVERSGLYYPQIFKKFVFFKWWGPIYVNRYSGAEVSMECVLSEARKVVDNHIKSRKVEIPTFKEIE